MEKITNVNIIATYIHNNPGCRRVDIKRHLYIARTGQEPSRGYHNQVSNQYFQTYGNASNVYLDRLWYNEIKNMRYQEDSSFTWWAHGKNVNRPGKSSYRLTPRGEDWVKSKRELVRPFKPGSLVEWQWHSPRRHGWNANFNRGLVIDRNKTYGLWVLGLDGHQQFLSHHAWIRAVKEGENE
tara:strand:- start:2369 stop:2914 length:546 start_codon:yes stop_codon:yes gene_type:complete